MRTIWKFQFPVEDEFTLDMPEGAQVLHVREQNMKPCLWALVNPDNPAEERHFKLRGTGHPIHEENPLKYLGTFFLIDGGFVGHVFE